MTLRPDQPSYLVFAKQMKNVPAACRQATPPVEEARAKRKQRTGSSCYDACHVAAAN